MPFRQQTPVDQFPRERFAIPGLTYLSPSGNWSNWIPAIQRSSYTAINYCLSFFWVKGSYFGAAPFTIDVKLSTVDAPNAGSILLDVIRALKVAGDKGVGGAIETICAYGFKRPPVRHGMAEAYRMFREFAGA